MKFHLRGLLLMVVGGFLAYVGAYLPLQQVDGQPHKILISTKAIVLCPAAFLLGLIFLGLGERAETLLGKRREPTAVCWAVILVGFALGIMLMLWVNARLAESGYAMRSGY